MDEGSVARQSRGVAKESRSEIFQHIKCMYIYIYTPTLNYNSPAIKDK